MNHQPTFFDFAAEVGLTKHIGGVGATEALIELCHIGRDRYILDAGCGVGATPCWMAKTLGCRVVGVDISPRMVERSRERARRAKVTGRVEFRVADAQDLPFPDGSLKTYQIDTQAEAKGILQRYGFAGMLRILSRMLALYARSPAYRGFVMQVRGTGLIPEHLDEYFGYGLFVGRK